MNLDAKFAVTNVTNLDFKLNLTYTFQMRWHHVPSSSVLLFSVCGIYPDGHQTAVETFYREGLGLQKSCTASGLPRHTVKQR